MSQHTPGPWFKPGMAVVLTADLEKKGIADCRTVDLTDDEAHGNARLIAAAPELLAMLEKCVAMMKGGDFTGLCNLVTKAEALLAKAEGR